MIQFYIENIAELTELPATESGHCVRVLRKGMGDEIYCVDGKGHRYRCRITVPDPKRCGIQVLEREEFPPHWGAEITLCFAPTKNMDRMEWMAEKCTEMGIDRFVPVDCRHSERHVLKNERLHKILVSAMKQSLKATLPSLEEMTPVKQVIADFDSIAGHPFEGEKYICYCSDEVERREFVREYTPGRDVAILIGPEGDFSAEEVRLAMEHGWVPVSLGKSRLRTETACLTAVCDVHCINQLNEQE